MRTVKEIQQRILEKSKELLSFQPEVLVRYLSLAEAKAIDMVEAQATEEEWQSQIYHENTREVILGEMRNYMATYGWDKALNHRGISASRTIDKMEAWIWLLGDNMFAEHLTNVPYTPYGGPQLKAICEQYGFPIDSSEAAVRIGRGLPCREGCNEGCIVEGLSDAAAS